MATFWSWGSWPTSYGLRSFPKGPTCRWSGRLSSMRLMMRTQRLKLWWARHLWLQLLRNFPSMLRRRRSLKQPLEKKKISQEPSLSELQFQRFLCCVSNILLRCSEMGTLIVQIIDTFLFGLVYDTSPPYSMTRYFHEPKFTTISLQLNTSLGFLGLQVPHCWSLPYRHAIGIGVCLSGIY